MLYGVDVHDGYQHGLSFSTLVRQGYTFCAVKLSQGVDFVRDQADEWIDEARTSGLIAGAYHWLTEADGAAQARWFWQCLKRVSGPEGLLIQLDCESDGYGQQITAWADEWRRLSGGHPFLIYSGAWWWPRTGGFDGSAVTPYLWHSRYLRADADVVPDDPAAFASRIPSSWWTPGYGGWTEATFIQFTSKGDAGNLANNVDLNCTRLSYDELVALTTPSQGSDEDVDTAQDALLFNASSIAAQTARMRDSAPVKRPDGSYFPEPLVLGPVAALKQIAADLAELKARPPVEAAPVDVDTLKAALADPAVLAAIVEAVNDDAARRAAE